MADHAFTALFPFCGIGPGARGFLDASVALLGQQGAFRALGGIDLDAGACRDFERLTGAPAWCVDVRAITPKMLVERFGARAPDVVFASPPCQGASRLLSSAKSREQKYEDLNQLALVWTDVMLAAWGAAPPRLVLIENVPGLPTRAGAMLRKLRSKLRAHGYVFHASTHDCGEIGGLAQHRVRYLLVARHAPSCPPLLYQPPKRRVRGVGEVLEKLPLPATAAARAWGDLHAMPRLSWRNWLRLALIPAGGDWRDLEGVLQGRARREVFRRHAVQRWDESHPAVTGPGGHSVEAVADPRVALPAETSWHRDALGVRSWEDASGAITGGADGPTRGRFSVADVRVSRAYDAGYGVLCWDEPARTVAATTAAGCGAYAVADGRDRGWLEGVRVMTLDAAMSLDLDPAKAPPFVPVIVAADGSWHRPMTLLELAALQGIPTTLDGQPLQLTGTRTEIATHVGNAVPVGAARAIAERMLVALVEGAVGAMSLGAGDVWVDRKPATEGAAA